MENELVLLAQEISTNPSVVAELHRIEAFQRVVTALIGEERAERQSRIVDVAHRLDVEWSVRSFLARVKFPELAPTIDQVRAADLAARYRAAAARPDAEVTSIVVIDGLDAYPYDFGEVALITLERQYLNEFFADGSSGSIPIDDLEGLFAFRFSRIWPGNRSWTELTYDVETTEHRMRSAAAPWLSFLNLYGGAGSFVRAIALYERSDSMTTWPPVRGTIGASPTMRPVYFGDDDEYEAWDHEIRLIVNNRDHFVGFLADVHDGYRAARAVSHRAETALRFFARAVEGYVLTDWLHDAEATQDTFIDLVSVLETIYVTPGDGRGKGQHIANRAAALCGDTVAKQRELRKLLIPAYDDRSSILHGDVQPSHEILTRNVRQIMSMATDSLVVFLKLGGEQRRLIDAVRDASLAQQNRSLLP